MMVNIIDDMLGTAGVMWSALYLLNLLQPRNTHVFDLAECRRQGKPVIVATQMLYSLNPEPSTLNSKP